MRINILTENDKVEQVRESWINNSQLESFDFNSPKTLQTVDFFHISGTYVKG